MHWAELFYFLNMATFQRNWLENSRIKELFPILGEFLSPSEPYPARFGEKLKTGEKPCGISHTSPSTLQCVMYEHEGQRSHTSQIFSKQFVISCIKHLPFWAEIHLTAGLALPLEGSAGTVIPSASHTGISFSPLCISWGDEILSSWRWLKPANPWEGWEGLWGTVVLLVKDDAKSFLFDVNLSFVVSWRMLNWVRNPNFPQLYPMQWWRFGSN